MTISYLMHVIHPCKSSQVGPHLRHTLPLLVIPFSMLCKIFSLLDITVVKCNVMLLNIAQEAL